MDRGGRTNIRYMKEPENVKNVVSVSGLGGDEESNNEVDFDDATTYQSDPNLPSRSYESSDDEDDNTIMNSGCLFCGAYDGKL